MAACQEAQLKRDYIMSIMAYSPQGQFCKFQQCRQCCVGRRAAGDACSQQGGAVRAEQSLRGGQLPCARRRGEACPAIAALQLDQNVQRRRQQRHRRRQRMQREHLLRPADSAAGKGQITRKATSAAVLATTQGVPAGTLSRGAGVQGAVQNGAPSTGKATAASGGGRKAGACCACPAGTKGPADAAATAEAAGEGPASVPENTQTFSTTNAGRTPGPKSALKMNGTGGKKLGSAKKRRAAEAPAGEAAGVQAAVLSNGAAGKVQLQREGRSWWHSRHSWGIHSFAC